MTVLGGICLVIWVYLLSVFYRNKLVFFSFLVGSIGLFLLLLLLRAQILLPLEQLLTATAGFFGSAVGVVGNDLHNPTLFIRSGEALISLPIGEEASGVLELFVFSSLLWFLPLFRLYEKIEWQVAGILWIFAANVLRTLLICLLLQQYGNAVFYSANTIWGRALFYLCTISLYFVCFTKTQVRRQRSGGNV